MMIPWWGGLLLFLVGVFIGMLMSALMAAGDGDDE